MTIAENPGREAEFRALVEPHLAQAYRTAVLILLDQGLAQDAVQEALIRAYRGLPRLHPDSVIGAWFHRLVVNEARRLARRQWRQPVPLEALPEIASAPSSTPEELLLAQEDRELLWTALGSLDELHRTVLVLRYYQGLTDPEIAAALAIPPGTVKSRLHAARQKLQRRLIAARSPWSTRLLNLLPRRSTP